MKKIVKTNPEFASEIVLSLPYVYWLHKNNLLEKVVVCKGMKPFYYFTDKVEEGFEFRSLDYSQWESPPYYKHYKNDLFNDLKPFVVVNNIFNIEPGKFGFRPYRYFDIKNLYDIFDYFSEKGYNVIYKRPNNTEFTLDQNEVQTLNTNMKLEANVDGVGVVNDYELCTYFDNVVNMNDLFEKYDFDYSTLNLMLFSETEGFVSINGGGSQFCAAFNKPTIIYTLKAQELRPGYLENNNAYIKKLSNAPIYPFFDDFEKWRDNKRNYEGLINHIKGIFK